MTDLEHRFEVLIHRLRTAYDGIGHSSGRPFVYFIYPPDSDRAVRRLADDWLRNDNSLTFHHIDLMQLTMDSLHGQEEKREALLNDPTKVGANEAIVRVWVRAVQRAAAAGLAGSTDGSRPVIVLRGLAALHPLTTPTGLMEGLAEQEIRNPRTNDMVPIVVLVPGVRVPHTSRRYLFLGLESLSLELYRGEEV